MEVPQPTFISATEKRPHIVFGGGISRALVGDLAVLTPNPPFPAYRFQPSLAQKEAGASAAFAEALPVFSRLALSRT